MRWCNVGDAAAAGGGGLCALGLVTADGIGVNSHMCKCTEDRVHSCVFKDLRWADSGE